MTFSGKDLIAEGYEPGPWFADVIRQAEERALSFSQAMRLAKGVHRDWLDAQPKHLALQDGIDFHVNMTAENDFEKANMESVISGFRELVKTPTIIAGAVMPDACNAGSPGTIPVGGVIGAKGAIHPGMHSADICCSMFVTVLDSVDPRDVLDAAHEITHFGPGGRSDGRFAMPDDLERRFRENAFLDNGKVIQAARSHLGT